jgi:hypothetical protein
MERAKRSSFVTTRPSHLRTNFRHLPQLLAVAQPGDLFVKDFMGRPAARAAALLALPRNRILEIRSSLIVDLVGEWLLRVLAKQLS